MYNHGVPFSLNRLYGGYPAITPFFRIFSSLNRLYGGYLYARVGRLFSRSLNRLYGGYPALPLPF